MKHSDLANNMATVISLLDAAGEVRGKKTFQTMVYLLQHINPNLKPYKFRYVPDYPKSEDLSSDLTMLVASGLVNEGLSIHGEGNQGSAPMLSYSLNRAGKVFLKEFEDLYKVSALHISVKLNMEQIAKCAPPRLRQVCLFVHRHEVETRGVGRRNRLTLKLGKRSKSKDQTKLARLLRDAGIVVR